MSDPRLADFIRPTPLIERITDDQLAQVREIVDSGATVGAVAVSKWLKSCGVDCTYAQARTLLASL